MLIYALVAGVLFGLIAGWVIGSQQANRRFDHQFI